MERLKLMRNTLKFRVWSFDNETCQVLQLDELAQVNPPPLPDQIDQFTGLLDKYNQEIYSGDILLCHDGDGDYFHHPVEYTVRSVPGEELDDIGYLQIPHNREVVGNLRQSFELQEEAIDS
jgi:hypothetical protein